MDKDKKFFEAMDAEIKARFDEAKQYLGEDFRDEGIHSDTVEGVVIRWHCIENAFGSTYFYFYVEKWAQNNIHDNDAYTLVGTSVIRV